MDISIDRIIGDRGPWAEKVERASQILQIVGADSIVHPSANWSFEQDDDGQPVLVLSLNDPGGSVAKRFEPDDLRDSEKLGRDLRRLWRKLLQTQTEQILKNLRADEPPGVTDVLDKPSQTMNQLK